MYVPAEVYKLLSPEAVIALKKYNSEALNKMAKKRGIHVTDVTDHGLSIAETNISEEQADPHQDDDAPEDEADPILDYINSQHHQEDDNNHALQAYNIMTSPFSDTTPQRSINSVHTHLFYHVAQAKQAQHGSLVDRGANGGLAGSDVRIISKSSRKCTVTGIDQHQINGLDIVQCTALVKTNHGYVNRIMNEYAYCGKGHTIHSSGQIEWNENQVDDRSVKVGGSQCITTLDGYSFPLKCTGGLMYLSIMGKPTDEELLKYPSVHLTSIHEWDPSVLDYSHPEGDGEPLWACDPQHLDLLDPNFDAHGLYTKRAINTLSSLTGVQQPPPMAISPSKSPIQACKTNSSQKHLILTNIGHISVGSMLTPSETPLSTPHNGEHQLAPFPRRNTSSQGTLLSISQEDMKLLPQIQCTLTPQQWTVGLNRHNFLLGRNPWSLIFTQ